MAKLKAGVAIGRYTLIDRIGRGGNAEVWRANAADEGGNFAVKVLTSTRPDARNRFRRELETQLGPLHGFSGILPVLDGTASDDPSVAAWLGMPVAEPITDALAGTDELEVRLRAVIALARVLSNLHEAGYAHRDVKPGNLYRFVDRWVVGDLGLVSVPEAEALTVGARALGPKWFIAPEMLNDPDTSRGAPADVYSLAKTMWVLVTGQAYPPPGTHFSDTPGLRPSSFVSLERSPFLDRLMERATAFDPADRPTAGAFADELAWIVEGVHLTQYSSAEDDYRALREELGLAAERRRHDESQREKRIGGGEALLQALVDAGKPTLDALISLDAPLAAPVFGHNDTVIDRASNWTVVNLEWQQGRSLVSTLVYDTGLIGPNRRAEIHLWSGFGVLVASDGNAILIAGHVVASSVVWTQSAKVPIGSMEAEQAVHDLAEGLRSNVPAALQKLLDTYKRNART